MTTALSMMGCSHFKFTSYDSFDEWFVAREDIFDPTQIGVGLPEGSFVGYFINDVVLRTPVYLVYEGTKIAVIPVAAPYYTCTYPFRVEETTVLQFRGPERPKASATPESSREVEDQASPEAATAASAAERDTPDTPQAAEEKQPDTEAAPTPMVPDTAK